MFSRILVPLDGSERAEQALPIAAHIARNTQGTLLLLECVTPQVEPGPYMGAAAPFVPQTLDTDTNVADSYLTQITQREQLAGLNVQTKTEYGWPAEQILAVAEQEQCDLIIMSSHGRSGFSRWVLGSVTQKIIRHASVPVLVLRDQQKNEALLATTPHLCATVPLDGSSMAESVLQPAAQILSAFVGEGQGMLHLIHIAPETSDENQNHQAIQQGRSYLATIEQRLHDEDMIARHQAVRTSVFMATDVADALLKSAEYGEDTKGNKLYEPDNLIMIATHGRSGLQRWTLGSVTERVLQATHLPLFIVRAQEHKE